MKQKFHFLAKLSMLILGVICLQSFLHKGGDYYKVLLNDKLVAEQYLTKPVALKLLSLNATNNNDRLTVYYSHCGHPGKNRSVLLKNENGKILKEWKFSDSKSQEMQLPISEVLKASANLNILSVYYSSTEIPAGKMLINLDLSAIAFAKR
jgi:hypothetical protein